MQASGIIKKIGTPYRKHIPPRAERAHGTVNELAKSMLIASLLPEHYFTDAHRVATYVYNRTNSGPSASSVDFLNDNPCIKIILVLKNQQKMQKDQNASYKDYHLKRKEKKSEKCQEKIPRKKNETKSKTLFSSKTLSNIKYLNIL